MQGPEREYNAQEQFILLSEYLGWYKNASAQIRVFHCLEMKHPEAEGVMRIRCYPFKKHPFQGRNIREPVMMMPLQKKKTFSLPQDRGELEYGRVMLFFSIQIPTHLGRCFEFDLAFIKYFDHYKVKGIPFCCLENVK